jgi:Zn-dependent protease
MTSRIRLFSILGFRISLDFSLFVLAAVLIFSLGGGYFPAMVEGIDSLTAYSLAAIGALGLFASIIFHELAHSLVARQFGLPVGGITLFIFGGIAELQHEPRTPGSEFWIAIAGPIASFVLAAGIYVLGLAAENIVSVPVMVLLSYLAVANLLLAIFNMLPAFPLDGGRVLRSILWRLNGDPLKSTRVATRMGTILGYAVMALGLYEIVVLRGFTGGLWYMLIGYFITNAAAQSRFQAEILNSLRGVPVGRVMRGYADAVPAGASLQTAVIGFFDRIGRKSFPVVDDAGAIAGVLPLSAVSSVPRERWGETLVRDVAQPLTRSVFASPNDDAFDTLMRLSNGNLNELVVVYNGGLAGSISRKDLFDFHKARMAEAGYPVPSSLED